MLPGYVESTCPISLVPSVLRAYPHERGRIITGPMEKWTARFTLQNRVLYDTSAFELGGTLWLQILAFRCLSM